MLTKESFQPFKDYEERALKIDDALAAGKQVIMNDQDMFDALEVTAQDAEEDRLRLAAMGENL
jgi:hypothetical protein